MSAYDQFNGICLASLENRLLTITFNNPERLNSFGGPLQGEFERILEIAAEDEEVSAILVRGEGRAFSAGGDVKGFNEQAQAGTGKVAGRIEDTMRGATKILDTMLNVPQPMIAAVHGYAMGLGATVALFCDVVVIAEDAVIADSHVNIGLVAGDGGAVMFPLLMSLGAAKWYLLTGDRISGTEAARIGMAVKAVPADELQAEATRMALKLAAGAPLALRGTKSTMNRIVRDRMDLLLAHGLLLEGATFISEDHKEAAAAFVEKRKPTFTGK